MGQEGCFPDKVERKNELLEVLSHPLRREVIHYFEDPSSGETADLEELASYIAQRIPEMNHENVTLHLAHTHIPKLKSHGWVEFDPRDHQVRYRGHDSAKILLSELINVFG